MLFKYVNLLNNCIPEQALELILSFKNFESLPATVGSGENNIVDDARTASVIQIPKELTNNISNALIGLYNNELKDLYQRDIVHVEIPQYLHYNEGGKYIPHNDSEELKNNKLTKVADRDLTIIVYLNDDYLGGELEMVDWGVTFKPKRGSVLCFPSYIEFTHQVHPVLHGNRYNIVTWMKLNDYIYPRPY